ncbi:MAG: T9SS type A sorting domain-containing protein [Saprospiraceae bacterium]|nr:T9SS type A sorting domain-containing protein [Saprospiraceae bacterium]
MQIDIDGTRNISATIFVKTDCAAFKTEGINALYPNPINGAQKMTLKYTSNNSIAGKLTVIDIHGKIVLNNVVELREGINSFYVDIENLVNGIYFVKLKTTKRRLTIIRSL